MYSKPELLTSGTIDFMDREGLMRELSRCKDCVRTEFTRQWMDRQSTEMLRVLLLAVQLYRAVKARAGGPDTGRLAL